MNNNDLSMLLKSQVVKLKAELDVSGSLQDISNDIEKISKNIESKDIGIKIPIELYSTIEGLNKDVAEIQKRLKSSKSAKKIELGVTLDANLKDLQKDISDLQTKLINSKTTKPIKLDVEINVQGSAGKIKEQFNTIQKVLEDFQKGYGGKLKDFSRDASEAIGGLVSKEAVAKVSGGIDTVRKKMEEGFGEGVFSSRLVSDSEGNVDRLIATMRNATGEIQTLSYKWDDVADNFVLLKQQDVNNIESNTVKAKNAIQGLYNSLQGLSTTGVTDEIRGQLDALGKMDSISMDAVKGIERLIQKEKEYQSMTSKREVLYSKIDEMMRSVASESSVAYKSLAFLEDGIVGAKTITDLNNVEKSIKGISEAVKEENKVQELRQKLIDDITQKENQLSQVKLRSSGIDSDNLRTALQQADALTAEAREIANVATTTKELQGARAKLNEVTKQYISTANTEIAQEAQAQKVYKTVDDIEKMLFKLKDMNKMSSEELKKALVDLDDSASGGIAKLTRYGNSVKESLDDAEREARELIQPLTLLDNTMKDMSSRELRQNILKAVDSNDLDMLKKYVGELQGGTVNLAKMTNTLDESGRAVARVTATMESNGKTAEKYVIDIDRGAESASRAVRQVNEELVFNANRNLGVLEQMRIAIERVPIWHMAQTLFRGITQGSKQVVEEIMKVNSAMTEIQRVADSSLNLDSMLKSSVQQAKDLGTNIHDVLGALGESARTFGDFNEQALLAVNQTAIIMDNVSDLNLDQSMNSLIGTMNAFNISAEDSIHIVNAFNEVDNQFAISTQQIASGMEKSASTAKTFGLEMEEVIGHITSIGSVTMESGERIGNALKTIYARITTNDKAISALEQVEISINKISETGEVVTRETGDIIEELAGKWNTLSDAERQSLGVNIAGVNQLSRFLAMMNNYSTAVDATTTAYSSQGSAMKEQQAYMDSYEAKINQVKTQFTEMALALGDSFLSDGIFMLIEALGKAIETGTEFVETYGLLPPLFGVIGTALVTLVGTDKIFDTINADIKSVWNGLNNAYDAIKEIGAGWSQGISVVTEEGTKAVGLFTKLSGGVTGLTSNFMVLGGSLLAGAGVVAAFVAVGIAIDKYIKKQQEAKRQMEEWNQVTEQALETYNNHGNDLSGLIDEYDALNRKMEENKDSMSIDETRRYNELINELQTALPQVVDYVDANGEAHLKSTDAIKEEVKWVERLAEEHQKFVDIEFNKEIEANIKSISDLGDKMAETSKEIESARKVAEEGFKMHINYSYDGSGAIDPYYMETVTDDKAQEEIAESQYKMLMQQYEMSKLIGDTTRIMQQYSIQVLSTSGNLDNMSDTAKRAVENISASNKALFEGLEGEEYQDMVDSMTAKTIEFGEQINEMYGRVGEGLEGTDLDTLRSKLDALVGAVPKEAFITDENLNTPSLDNYMITIEALIGKIRNGDNDFKSMISTLEAFGYSNIDATNFVAELGRTMNNQAIITALSTEELSEFTSELNDVTEATMSAIDPLSMIFGKNDEAVDGVNSYLEMLKILRKNTDDYLNTSQGQMAINQLADYWGLNKQYISENIDELSLYWDTMSNINYDKEGNLVFPEDTPQQAKDFVNRMLEAGVDGGRGLVDNFRLELGAINDITDEMVNEMNSMFEELEKNPEDSMTKFLKLMQSHLDNLEGSFTLVNGKIMFADGSSSQYMDNLNEKLEEYGVVLSTKANETGEFFELVAQPPNEESGRTISKVTMLANDGIYAIDHLKDVYWNFANDTSNVETGQTYFDTIKRQAELTGKEIGFVNDESGNLKLSFTDGTTSVWLETLQTQFNELDAEIVETGDKEKGFRDAIKIGEDYIFLDDILSKSYNTKEELQKAIDKTNELKEATSGGLGEGKLGGGGGNFDSTGAGIAKIEESTKLVDDYLSKVFDANNTVIEPKVSQETNSQLKTVTDNVATAESKIVELNTKLSDVKGSLEIATAGLETVVTVGSTITGIAGYAQDLAEKLSTARAQLSTLVEESQRDGMSFTGLQNGVKTIEDVVGRMRISLNGIKDIVAEMIISVNTSGGLLNITPIRDYQTAFSLHMLMINSQASAHMDLITEEFARLRRVLSVSTSNLNQHESDTDVALLKMSGYYSSFTGKVNGYIQLLAKTMTEKYAKTVISMTSLSETLKDEMIKDSVTMQTTLKNNTKAMGDAMVTSFRATVKSLATEAGKIPSLVGKGITDNMNSSTSAITSLADNLVKNFKSALGIHSPSRVFEELGGFVMDGLVNGLSNGNLTDLGGKVFSEFGNGAFDTIDSIKGFLSADWAVANGSVKDWIASAVGITGVPSSWIAPLMQIAQHESGGNPKAINNWDINAKNGIPSKGLMQTIDPTFQANMMSGFGDIWNPVHNAIASIQYILKRYGNVWNVPGIKGLISGTGYVGYGSDVQSSEYSSESSVSTGGDFFASSAFSGESLGGGVGSAVGNIVSTTNSFPDAFSASATDSKELEALFKVNSTQRDADVLSAMLRRANTEVKAMTENTLAYRNALKEVNKQEEAYMKKLKTQLSQQKSRHAQVAKEIKSLSNTSKHTEEQRKRYNELQREFESSLDTIYSLENEVRSMEISISGRAIEIFEDYISEIINKYEKAIDGSNAKIDDIEFKLSVNDYKETDTLLDNMVLENQKLGHLLGQESTIRNQIADLNTAYKSAQSRYGKNSKQAQIAYQAMLQSEEDLEDAILNRLKQEQKIKDERKRVSDDSIKTLKDYYGKVQSITTNALEMEREELKKNHELKMSQYDEEIARINAIYDSKLESIDKDKEEAQYSEQLNAKNSERVELMNKIAKASRDTSLEGRKQLSELQGQLATINDEMLNMQTERQEKLYKEAIEAQRKQQIEAVERQKETAEKENQVKISAVELQMEQAKQAYGELVNDEVMWKDLSDKFMKGDTNPLLSMVDSMETQLAQMMSGNYSSIIPNFKELSSDIKKELASSNAMDLGNFALEMNETVEDIKDMVKFMRGYSATSTGAVNYNNPSETTTGSGLKYSSSVDTYAPKQTAQPVQTAKPAEVKPQRQHTIVNGDTLWDLAQKFYGNPFKWTTIAQANKNPDPYKLQIGRKLIIPFKSGGFTGDWVGDEGRIAMLHKKELVLNAEQTEHILSSAKLMDSVMRMMPKFNAKQSTPQFATAGGQNITIENMELKFDKFKGTREDANNMVDTFITKLKKM